MRKSLGLILLSASLWIGCQPKQTTAENQETVSETPETNKETYTNGIVYVNNDSLMKHFKLAAKLREMLEAETVRLQTELANKERKLYSDLESLKREARNLSQFEGQQRQKKLINEEQELMLLKDRYTNNLLKMEQDATFKVDETIEEYLGRYCEDKSIDMVFSYSKLGVIRWARKGTEITNEVIEGLNAEYDKEQQQADTTQVSKGK